MSIYQATEAIHQAVMAYMQEHPKKTNKQVFEAFDDASYSTVQRARRSLRGQLAIKQARVSLSLLIPNQRPSLLKNFYR